MQDTPTFHHFGAHPAAMDGQSGWVFRLYAPDAAAVSLVGEFNQWDSQRTPMQCRNGIWSVFLPYLREYDVYQFAIRTRNGDILYKSDPYAFHSETHPGACSKLYDIANYRWHDQNWFAFRAKRSLDVSPFHLYEVHLGSWRRTGQDEVLPYRMIAKFLIPYVKEMGFTGVLLMPVLEHEQDSSYGYRPDSWYAPTSRFGPPKDFMYLVDELHSAGVAVLMDWPCAAFPMNEYGLASFDGSSLFEAAPPNGKGQLPFDFSSPFAWRFLLDSALFWLEQYHLDGLRVCGVPRDCPPSLQDFLQTLLDRTREAAPGRAILLDSASPLCGLSCDRDWVDGLLHTFTSTRQDSAPALPARPARTGSMLALDHRALLPRGGSLVAAMTGALPERLAKARLLHLLLLAYPGKKVTFMSSEFGQENGWNYHHSLDWHLLHYEPYHSQQAFFRDANMLYLSRPALWQLDNSPEGFRWLLPPASGQGVAALRRSGPDGSLFFLFNLSGDSPHTLRFGVERPGYYRILLNSDGCCYGGKGLGSYDRLSADPIPEGRFPCSLLLEVPPLGGIAVAFDAPPEPHPVLISPC